MTFKELIDSKGLSAKEVSRLCDCSLSTAYNWLSGMIEPKKPYRDIIENYKP